MVEFDPQSILEPLLAHEKACWVRVVLDIEFEFRVTQTSPLTKNPR
jgi:hypothetical protein